MNEKRYIVPEGMLKAGIVGAGRCVAPVERILEAALRWLSENPIEATYQDWQQFCVEHPRAGVEPFPAWWQRRMVLAPEPEVPEAVKDLLYDPTVGPTKIGRNDAIFEAFRRGQNFRHNTDRWNVHEDTGRAIMVCRGDHHNSAGCNFVRYVPEEE